jgi:hypothetical protein
MKGIKASNPLTNWVDEFTLRFRYIKVRGSFRWIDARNSSYSFFTTPHEAQKGLICPSQSQTLSKLLTFMPILNYLQKKNTYDGLVLKSEQIKFCFLFIPSKMEARQKEKDPFDSKIDKN